MNSMPFHHLARGLATAILIATPAFAQLGSVPPVPIDGFRAPGSRLAAPPPSSAPAADAAAAARAPGRQRAGISTSPDPIFDEGTYERLSAAYRTYELIAAAGGWPTLPKAAKLVPGATGPDVATLRQRLALTGDLPSNLAGGDTYDDALIAAVKIFQARHGLPETGSIGGQTLAALNVPAAKRVRQLASSLDRLSRTHFNFGQRYVVVNIPGAVIEAVSGGKVERRYIAVVGKPDRPSPSVTSAITTINLNPTWTVPLSIVKRDIIPKVRKDPAYLDRMHMRVIDAEGYELEPTSIDWYAATFPYTIRQDPGPWNALGVLRIDMPNPHSVYMHDTNHRNLFNADYRFQSSGCTRVSDPRDLATWLLQDTPGWTRARLDAGIATTQRIDVKLAHTVPVAWIYLTGWQSRDGRIHFRNDIYRQDDVPTRPFMVSLPKPVVTAAQTAGFSLQSGESHPVGATPEFKEVSYLDSQ